MLKRLALPHIPTLKIGVQFIHAPQYDGNLTNGLLGKLRDVQLSQ
jgi:hypothetical protein